MGTGALLRDGEQTGRALYNKKEKTDGLARKIDLENHVKKLALLHAPSVPPPPPSALGEEEDPTACAGTTVRSSVTLGDSLDLILLPDGERVALRALQRKRDNPHVSTLHCFTNLMS